MAHLQAQLSIKPTQVMYLMKCMFNFQGPLGESSPIRSHLMNFSPIRTGRGQVDTQKLKHLQIVHKTPLFSSFFDVLGIKKPFTQKNK